MFLSFIFTGYRKNTSTGHATADQHHRIWRIDYHVTGRPQVATNRSPTGRPWDTLIFLLLILSVFGNCLDTLHFLNFYSAISRLLIIYFHSCTLHILCIVYPSYDVKKYSPGVAKAVYNTASNCLTLAYTHYTNISYPFIVPRLDSCYKSTLVKTNVACLHLLYSPNSV